MSIYEQSTKRNLLKIRTQGVKCTACGGIGLVSQAYDEGSIPFTRSIPKPVDPLDR